MKLKGSCHCGAVSFECESLARVPYLRCYCNLCRKTAGGGGYSINLKATTKTLKITGPENLTEYKVDPALLSEDEHSGGVATRSFCKHCGSCLWASNSLWPQWIFPFASAMDSELPKPPEEVHIMLEFSPDWCRPDSQGPHRFKGYPNEDLETWHKRHGIE